MKKHKAVFTIVKNEKVMLPIWLRYYSKYFSVDDIIVLDHQSTDGSTQDLPCKRRFVSSEFAFDHAWLNRVVRNYQVELLRYYNYVLFAEADEFIFHKDGLDNYIDNFKGVSVACNGFEVQHVTGVEPDLDLTRSVLEQRSYWYHNGDYCKTLLSSVPTYWGLGFHGCVNPGIFDENLYLAHLHRVDYKLARQKNEERAKLKWNKLDLEERYGFQNRILGDQFDSWFESYRFHDLLRPIPFDVKNSYAF